MLHSMSPTGGTHGRRLLVAAVAALLILGAVATYSVFTHAHRDSAPPASGPARHPIRPSSQATPNDPATLAPVDATADPATFARRVAAALFDWDTSSLTTPGDSIARLAAVDDPTGESSTALVSDVTSLPADRGGVGRPAPVPDASVGPGHLGQGPEAVVHRGSASRPARAAARHRGLHHPRHPAPDRHLGRPPGHHGPPGRLHDLPRLRPRLPAVPPAAALPARRPAAVR